MYLETIFENKIILTKEVIAEYAQKNFKVFGKRYRMFVLLMFIISAGYGLVTLIINRSIGVFAFFFYLQYFFYLCFIKAI